MNYDKEVIKQLSRTAYEIFALRVKNVFTEELPLYDEMKIDIKPAIEYTLEAILESINGKHKRDVEIELNDIGRILYHKFLAIRKRHKGIVLYNSIPVDIKDEYRKLALTVIGIREEEDE